MKQQINTQEAPKAIGTYSQAIKSGNTVYLSGQIPLDPKTMELIQGDMQSQLKQIFANIEAVAKAAGGSLEHIVKLTVFLTDMSQYVIVNEAIKEYFQAPYPARSLIGVAALPKQAIIEVEAVMHISD